MTRLNIKNNLDILKNPTNADASTVLLELARRCVLGDVVVDADHTLELNTRNTFVLMSESSKTLTFPTGTKNGDVIFVDFILVGSGKTVNNTGDGFKDSSGVVYPATLPLKTTISGAFVWDSVTKWNYYTLSDDLQYLSYYVTSSQTLQPKEHYTRTYIVDQRTSGLYTLTIPDGTSGQSLRIIFGYWAGTGDVRLRYKELDANSGSASTVNKDCTKNEWFGKEVTLSWNDSGYWEKQKGGGYSLTELDSVFAQKSLFDGSDVLKLANTPTIPKSKLSSAVQSTLDNSQTEADVKSLVYAETRKRHNWKTMSIPDLSISQSGATPDMNYGSLYAYSDVIVPTTNRATVSLADPNNGIIPFDNSEYTTVQVRLLVDSKLKLDVEMNSAGTAVDSLKLVKVNADSTTTDVVQITETINAGIQFDKGSFDIVSFDNGYTLQNGSGSGNTYSHMVLLRYQMKGEVRSGQKTRGQIFLKQLFGSNPIPFTIEFQAGRKYNFDKTIISENMDDILHGMAQPAEMFSEYVASDYDTSVAQESWIPSFEYSCMTNDDGTKVVSCAMNQQFVHRGDMPSSKTLTVSSPAVVWIYGESIMMSVEKSGGKKHYLRVPAKYVYNGNTYNFDVSLDGSKCKGSLAFTNHRSVTVAYDSTNDGWAVKKIYAYVEAPHHATVGQEGVLPILNVGATGYSAGADVPNSTQRNLVYANWNKTTGAISSPYGGSGSFTAKNIVEAFYNGSTTANTEYDLAVISNVQQKFPNIATPNQFVGWVFKDTASPSGANEIIIKSASEYLHNGEKSLTNTSWTGNDTPKVEIISRNRFKQVGSPFGRKVLVGVYFFEVGHNHIDHPQFADLFVTRMNQTVPAITHAKLLEKRYAMSLTAGIGASVIQDSRASDDSRNLKFGGNITVGTPYNAITIYVYQGKQRIARASGTFSVSDWNNPTKFIDPPKPALHELTDVSTTGATTGQVLVRKSDGTYGFITPSGGGAGGYNSIISTQSNTIYADKSDGSKPVAYSGFWRGRPSGSGRSPQFLDGYTVASLSVQSGSYWDGDSGYTGGLHWASSGIVTYDITFNKNIPIIGIFLQTNRGMNSRTSFFEYYNYSTSSWVRVWSQTGGTDSGVLASMQNIQTKRFRMECYPSHQVRVGFYVKHTPDNDINPFPNNEGSTASTITITNASTHNPKTDGLIANNSSKPNIVVDAGQQIVKTVFDGDKFIPTEITVNAGDIIQQTLTTNQAVWYHLK